jgi:hypothetical protein
MKAARRMSAPARNSMRTAAGINAAVRILLEAALAFRDTPDRWH